MTPKRPGDESVGTDTGEVFVSEGLAVIVLEPDKTPPGPKVIPLADEEVVAEVTNVL